MIRVTEASADKQVMQHPRRQDADVAEVTELNQRPVAGHQRIGTARDRGAQYGQVIDILKSIGRDVDRHDDHALAPQHIRDRAGLLSL